MMRIFTSTPHKRSSQHHTTTMDQNDCVKVSMPTVTIVVGNSPDDGNNDDDAQQQRHDISNDNGGGGGDIAIYLSQAEDELLTVLRAVAQVYEAAATTTTIHTECSSSTNDDAQYPSNSPTKLQPAAALVQVRIAGGWVRDKILYGWSQRQSLQSQSSTAIPATTAATTTLSDIDVTLNACSGVQFATLLQDYLQSDAYTQSTSTSNVPKQRAVRLSCRPTSSVGIIAANPAQSKHLETATMHVIATTTFIDSPSTVTTLSLDFCQLRSAEVYSDSSRIPTIQIGTALEDAQRRDFTVNALFYNVTSRLVEDWTGRGVPDLRARRLVTPLDAFVTFKDDPLRVLRAVRFAIRYHLTPHADLVHAACGETIHEALRLKVSRERVGKELEGMLSGLDAQPIQALSLLMEWHLAPVVLALPVPGVLQCRALDLTTSMGALVPFSSHDESMAWDQARRILPLIPTVWRAHASHVNGGAAAAATTNRTPSHANERLLILAAVVLPLRHVVVTDLFNKNSSVTTYIVKESLKFKNADIAAIAALTSLVDEAANLLRGVHASSPTDMSHDSDHSLSARPSRLEAGLLVRQAKELWVTLLLLATILLSHQPHDEDDDSTATAVDWIQVGAHTYHRIVALGLDQCWQWRPLLDGQALMSTLSLPRGPTVGLYMEEQVRWMLAHPDGTLDDCVSYLQAWVAPANTSPTVSKRGDKRKQNGA
jgi:tRNA nucleotidyltransferase (CCA-adding enzyme)